ncbi:MAG: tRNA 2-thiouridine(34) synthase MnmA [Bacteroidaceae bacterium]|nr:tRNA 2-thiouridine(34) synthase MnmA [Bacteroidaceae bacterium]
MECKDKKRVLLGMSGGIDSTAAVLLLQKEGYTVVGLTIRNHDLGMEDTHTEPPYICEARRVAAALGVEHYVEDARAMFKSVVVKPFVDEWLAGRTPNPCIECNPRFKFHLLVQYADKLNCHYIATGHYSNVVQENGIYYIERGRDSKKDQSYFLWRLSQDVLSRTLFPLGDLTKEDIRQLLKENGMQVKASDGESMEVCFIEDDYRTFLKRELPNIDTELVGPGKFVDSAGKLIGEHKGYPYYTIGQRKGLAVAFGTPKYVIRTNPEKNTVMLGDADQLLTNHMLVDELNLDNQQQDNLTVRIRYRSNAIGCKVVQQIPDGRWLIRFNEQASAVTPGQSAVFYVADRVVGGAVISSQKGINQYIS